MAEAVGLAASILGIAGAGISITTTLYRFTKSYQSTDHKVESIVTTVSVTSSILTELGNATKEHPEDLQKLNRWALFSDTIAACKRDFEIIEAAIGNARKADTVIHDQQKMRKDAKGKATPWQKLKWAIGGEKDIDDLLNSLERSKSNLQLLLDTSNYDILRKLEKSHALNPELAEQLTEIRAILPWLVTNMMKLGYRPDRADVSNKNLTGFQGVSSDEQKAPPEEVSMPPAQEVKDKQKRSSIPDVRAAIPNQSVGKDAPQPLNVQDPLSPLEVSRSPVEEVPQDPSPKNSNHVIGDLPVVEPNEDESPAARSDRFDRANYESWSLTYRKAHVKKEKEYFEIVVITRLIKLKCAQVREIPESYRFVKLQPSESELKLAVLGNEAARVIEFITSLPLPAQKAVDRLLKRRKAVRPTVVKVNIVKQPLWRRIVGRRKSWPSLVVFLECTPEISKSSYSNDYMSSESSSSSLRGRNTDITEEVVTRRRRSRSPSHPREKMLEEKIIVEKSRRPPEPKDDVVEIIEQHSSLQRSSSPLSSSPSTYKDEQEVGEDDGQEHADKTGRIPSDEGQEYDADASAKYFNGMKRFSRSASTTSGGQALPSEQDAERIMEEFLSGLTTSQDGEDSTFADDAAAAAAATMPHHRQRSE
ncbi:hypothetical protein MMC07_002584 [Pseudocyphellaria aurata]|nr:hypothetical protein [Pseudocyphellaria aurata]